MSHYSGLNEASFFFFVGNNWKLIFVSPTGENVYVF